MGPRRPSVGVVLAMVLNHSRVEMMTRRGNLKSQGEVGEENNVPSNTFIGGGS
jgi:hypothetical protein